VAPCTDALHAAWSMHLTLRCSVAVRHTINDVHRHVGLQALICVALGLPPTAFRRLVQANAATTVLHFAPSAGQEAEDSGGVSAADSAPTRAVLRHMNQSPEVMSNLAAGGPPVSGVRIILVACGSGTGGSSRDVVDAVVGAVLAFQVDVQ
jgi:hypothetical protein